MNRILVASLVITAMCTSLLLGGCSGDDSVNIITVEHATTKRGEEVSILKDTSLPVLTDFRKNLHSGVGAKIISAKAVGYIHGGFSEGAFVLFDSVIEIHGKNHSAKILIKQFTVTRGKNIDGPFVNIPQPGESLQVTFLNDCYYGPIEHLNLD